MQSQATETRALHAPATATGPRAVAAVVAGMVSVAVAPFIVGALSIQIGSSLEFTASDVALAVAAYYLTSAVFSPVGGTVVAALGPARALRLACAGSTAGLVMIATASSTRAIVVALALLGLPNSLVQPASNQILAGVESARLRGLSFGLVQSAIPIATLLSGLSLAAAAHDFSWRTALVLVAALTLVGQVLIGRGRGMAGSSRVRPAAGIAVGRDPGGPVLMVALVLGGLLASMAATTLPSFVAVTGAHHGFDPGDVAGAQILGSLACVGVRVLATWRGAELRGAHVLLTAAALVGAGGAGYLSVSSGTVVGFVIGVVVAYGCGWGWNGLFNLSITHARPHRIARSTGRTQAGIFFGGVIGPLLFAAVARSDGLGAAWTSAAAAAAASAVVLGLAGRRWGRSQHHDNPRETKDR